MHRKPKGKRNILTIDNLLNFILVIIIPIVLYLILLPYKTFFKVYFGTLGSYYIAITIFVIWILLIYDIISILYEKRTIRSIAKDKYPKLSIVAIMFKRTDISTSISAIIIVISFMIYLLLSFIINYKINIYVLIVFMSFFILIYVNKFIFKYRIKNGFYGTNKSEAIEIIEFIINNSKKIEFTENGKTKEVLSQDDLAVIKNKIREISPAISPAFHL